MMVVRPCRRDEVGAVLDVWSRARSAHAATPDTAEAVAGLLDRDGEALLVADRDGEIVGTLVAGWDGWRGNMYRLAVLPEHRRQGVARALVQEGEHRLHARGARRVTALVGHDDHVALATWESAGYVRDAAIGRLVRNLGP